LKASSASRWYIRVQVEGGSPGSVSKAEAGDDHHGKISFLQLAEYTLNIPRENVNTA
jgi:hypothetical protein